MDDIQKRLEFAYPLAVEAAARAPQHDGHADGHRRLPDVDPRRGRRGHGNRYAGLRGDVVRGGALAGHPLYAERLPRCGIAEKTGSALPRHLSNTDPQHPFDPSSRAAEVSRLTPCRCLFDIALFRPRSPSSQAIGLRGLDVNPTLTEHRHGCRGSANRRQTVTLE